MIGNTEVSTAGPLFERASFFNKDTGYVSGFIHKDSKQEIIYWTNNGGKSWEEVKFGESSWIDANFINYKGQAWMSGSSQFIYYSKDFGKTWETKRRIEPGTNMRISSIYFQDGKTGIVGSHWNRIYLTNDNCYTWKNIPTPLDQKKYQKVFKETRPEINKIQLFKDRIIVSQEDKIFYTNQDTINWIALPEFIDFAVDEHFGKLFVIDLNGKVRILNEKLELQWTSSDSIVGKPICVKTFNGSLVAWYGQEFYKIDEKEFYRAPMFTSDHPIPSPEIRAKATFRTWGIKGRELLASDDFGKSWYRLNYLPFYIGNLRAINDSSAILSTYDYSKYYLYSSNSNQLTPYKLIKPLEEFSATNIESFTIEKGSQGCFHSNRDIVSYNLQGDVFKCTKKETSGEKGLRKASYKNAVSKSIVTGILELINNPYLEVSFEELEISEQEKSSYLTKIEEIENDYKKGRTFDYEKRIGKFYLPYSHIDFAFYKNQKDSLQKINNALLTDILSEKNGGWSTTTNWVKITFKNKKEELSIINSDYEKNGWYLPWYVSYNGIIYPCNSIQVTKFIEEYAPAFVENKENRNVFTIFQIVDYLYKNKVDKINNCP